MDARGLDGRVVVITGSTRGLGLATAQAFRSAGALVVVSSRTPSAVERAVALLGEEHAAGAAADVSDATNIASLRDLALARFGRLDVWINNAGLSGAYGPTPAIDEEDVLRVLDTNIRGTYLGSMVAVRHFLAQGSGKLINVLGRGDRQPVPYQNAYASSKAWARAFTLALAKETRGHGVGVFAFNPGLMRTDLVGRVRAVRGFERRVAPLATVLRLWSTPLEVPAAGLVRLASSQTDGKTGLSPNVLGPGRMLGGLVNELWRRIRGAPAETITLDVETIEPAVPWPPVAEAQG
jgi:NAD(P)-dependent dehydrogenase (short-subunit alcohol dehydrogenase family)